MVIRVYVSGISGNKEVKKRQQRVTMILDSKNIEYTVIDIAEPGKENEKEFMQENSKARDSKHALPPQIFNDSRYCGDYEDFDMANELDELEKFLNLTQDSKIVENGMRNGPKVDADSKGLLKEDIRESTEEIVDIVSRTEPEAVSIGNKIESSDPDEILKTLGDTSRDIRDPSKSPDESLAKDSNDSSPKNDAFDEIPKTDDQVSKEPHERESLGEEDIDSDIKNEGDSVDETNSEN